MRPHYVRESEPHWSDIAAESDANVIRNYSPRYLGELAAKVMANEWRRQKESSKRKGCWRPSREKESI